MASDQVDPTLLRAGRPRTIRSSGGPEGVRACRGALRATRRFGPTPTHRTGTGDVRFLREIWDHLIVRPAQTRLRPPPISRPPPGPRLRATGPKRLGGRASGA